MRACSQEHNWKRVAGTIQSLVEAMDRMRSGKVIHLLDAEGKPQVNYDWTKDNWAIESGRHISTILRKKPDGGYVFAEQIEAFEQGKPKSASASNTALRLRIKELESTKARLERVVADTHRQNADLQRRCNRLEGKKDCI